MRNHPVSTSYRPRLGGWRTEGSLCSLSGERRARQRHLMYGRYSPDCFTRPTCHARFLFLRHAERLESSHHAARVRAQIARFDGPGQGDQPPEFLAISPNAKMPAIVDHDVEGEPVSVFESGAILYYWQKTGQFMDFSPLGRKSTRVAVLANRQSRTHGRPTQPLRQLRAARAGLFAQALQRRV